MAKTVKKINESDLLPILNKVVIEAVAKAKTQWIAEQEVKHAAIIETRVNEALKRKISQLLSSDKK
jgi:hypothetical protein